MAEYEFFLFLAMPKTNMPRPTMALSDWGTFFLIPQAYCERSRYNKQRSRYDNNALTGS